MRLLLLLAVCVLQSDAGKTHTYRVGAAYQGSRGNQYYDSYTMSYSIGLALENHPPRASGCLTCNGGCSIGGGLVIPPELWTPSSTPLDLEINFAVWEGKTAATDYSCAGDGPKLYTRTCRISMEDYAEAETNVYRCVGDGGYLLVYFYWRDASTQAPPTPSPPTPSPPTPAPPLMCSAFSCPDNWSPKAGNVACTTRHLQADMCGGISIKDGSTGSARCCSHNGADCVTTDAGGSCYGDTLTYSQAMDVCALDGRRLCTVAELTQCCGTGCSYDYTHVWVSDVVPVSYCDKETCCDAPTPAPPTPSPPTPSPLTPPTYIGCYEDTNLRDLDGASSFWGTHASPELCSEYCLTAPGAPYRYMGLQDSTACMCGNSYGTYGSVPESECSMSCVQDLSSTCGAVWRNSVYEVGSVGTAAPATLEPTPSPLTPPTYIGCYGDTSVRDLDGASSFSGTHASPELCSEYCLTAPGAPFLYMGLQDSTACMCGNSYGTYGSVPESECSMSCSQDPSSMCGNHWRNSVYEVGFSGM